MAVKFCACWMFRPTIERVEIVRETESSVFVTDKKHRSKRGAWEAYFDTWQEAHAYLLAQVEGKVKQARYALDSANDRFGNVKGMKPPQEPSHA